MNAPRAPASLNCRFSTVFTSARSDGIATATSAAATTEMSRRFFMRDPPPATFTQCSALGTSYFLLRTSYFVLRTSDVVSVHVLVDHPLKLPCKLVIRPAQRGDVPAVDEHGAVRRLAGSRQGDPDVGGLRFARPIDHAAHHGDRHRFDARVRLFPD